jgi:hypothetical protein
MKRVRIVAVVLAVPVLGSFLPLPRVQNGPANRLYEVRLAKRLPAKPLF